VSLGTGRRGAGDREREKERGKAHSSASTRALVHPSESASRLPERMSRALAYGPVGSRASSFVLTSPAPTRLWPQRARYPRAASPFYPLREQLPVAAGGGGSGDQLGRFRLCSTVSSSRGTLSTRRHLFLPPRLTFGTPVPHACVRAPVRACFFRIRGANFRPTRGHASIAIARDRYRMRRFEYARITIGCAQRERERERERDA